MANRMKEDEKNEKIIRGLLKLPANRRCIDCNSLGPQYVCTNFWTFICMNCSGIHREFTHRVKSVSMAKFTSQEVAALQEGGNERGKNIYFKEWDPQRHSFPDTSNVNRLREFIKHVYVDRRYSGERSVDRPPRVKGDREDSYENRRPDAYQGGSRSPPYGETYERRYGERPSSGERNDNRNFRYSNEERRSPGYEHGDYRRSPARVEVDDRRRDDRFGNGYQNRRFEDRRFSDGIPKPEERSRNHPKESEMSNPPLVRPVRDILGEDIPPLRVGESPNSNGSRVPDVSAQIQRTASSSSMGSAGGSAVELKSVNSGSLIDFNTIPEPSPPAASQQSAVQKTSSANDSDWASFELATQEKVSQSTSNSLESALAQLSTPGTAPASDMSKLSTGGVDSLIQTYDGGQWPIMQHNQAALVSTTDSHSTVPPSTALVSGTPTHKSWASSVTPNLQGSLTVPTGQPSQAATRPHLGTSTGEAKLSGRTELPADLFTATYSMVPVSVPGWQAVQHLGVGYGMQYPTAVTMPSFANTSISSNPFDLANEPTLAHATSFPSMASLQGTLPTMADPSSLLRSSSFGAPPQWVRSHQPSYASAAPPSAYMLQQTPGSTAQQAPNNSLPMGHQGLGGFGSQGAAFGAPGVDQRLTARYTQPGTPSSFPSVGGNPFG